MILKAAWPKDRAPGFKKTLEAVASSSLASLEISIGQAKGRPALVQEMGAEPPMPEEAW